MGENGDRQSQWEQATLRWNFGWKKVRKKERKEHWHKNDCWALKNGPKHAQSEKSELDDVSHLKTWTYTRFVAYFFVFLMNERKTKVRNSAFGSSLRTLTVLILAQFIQYEIVN